MKVPVIILLAIITILSIGCSTPGKPNTVGETRFTGEQIRVSIGQKVLNRPEKVEALRKDQGVKKLYQYVNNLMRAGNIRPTLKLDIKITQFRVGWGASNLATHVLVLEEGIKLTSFDKVVVTTRNSERKQILPKAFGGTAHAKGVQVRILVKALAEQIYKEIKNL